MDIVAKRRAREFTLLMLVSGMALIANLPERVLMLVHFDRGIVMAVLGLVVHLVSMLRLVFGMEKLLIRLLILLQVMFGLPVQV